MADGKPPWRKLLLWSAGTLVAMPAILVGALVLWFAVADDPLGAGPRSVTCDDAMEVAGIESLPVEPEAAECTAGGFTDSFTTIGLTSTRVEAAEWLAAEFPGIEPDAFCPHADLCYRMEPGVPEAPPNHGWYLAVELTEHADGNATVSVTAHTI